MTYHCN